MTMGMLGGMIGPTTPAAATTLAENSTGNPRFFMRGIRVEPIAVASATAEPVMPAKKHEATITTWARPPWIHPTR